MRGVRGALGAILVAGALLTVGAAPGAAVAAVADCAFYPDAPERAADARQYVTPPAERIPPPLRALAARWSCATAAADLDLASPATEANYAYLGHLVGAEYDGLLGLLRAFQADGWTDGVTGVRVDETGDLAFRDATLDELAGLDDPSTVQAHYVLADAGDVQIEYRSVGGSGRPELSVAVLLERAFPADGLADPSVLSGLRTIPQALPTPTQAAVVAGGAVMLMLVVGYPSSLLNSVVGSRYDALVTRVRRLLRRPAGDEPGRPRGPRWLIWPGFAIAALVGAFIDPDFGINAMSLRVVVTLFLSFLLFNLATWAIVRRVARRLQPDSGPYLRFRWGSLVILALAVVLARLLGFEPGVVFGLVSGLAYATALTASRSAVVVLVGSGFGLLLAALAWTGYSLLAPVAAASPDSVVLVFLAEFLSGVTIKGVSTLPLSLLPLGNLDGAKVARWHRWAWGVAYAVGLAAFMIVLLTIPKSWGDIPGDFVRWLAIFLAYAVVAVVVWAVNARRLAREAAAKTGSPSAGDAELDQPAGAE